MNSDDGNSSKSTDDLSRTDTPRPSTTSSSFATIPLIPPHAKVLQGIELSKDLGRNLSTKTITSSKDDDMEEDPLLLASTLRLPGDASLSLAPSMRQNIVQDSSLSTLTPVTSGLPVPAISSTTATTPSTSPPQPTSSRKSITQALASALQAPPTAVASQTHTAYALPIQLFSLADLLKASGVTTLEGLLGPEIGLADVSVALDGKYIETSSGPAARELKRQYDHLAGVGPTVRSPYAITGFVNQHGKSMYRVGHRDEHSAPATSSARVSLASASASGSSRSHSLHTYAQGALSSSSTTTAISNSQLSSSSTSSSPANLIPNPTSSSSLPSSSNSSPMTSLTIIDLSNTNTSPKTKRRSRLSMHFSPPSIFVHGASRPSAGGGAVASASANMNSRTSTGTKKLRKTRSIPDLAFAAGQVQNQGHAQGQHSQHIAYTFSTTGRAHSQSVNSISIDRDRDVNGMLVAIPAPSLPSNLSAQQQPLVVEKRKGDAFADVMGWSVEYSSTLNAIPGTIAPPANPIARSVVTNPFGTGVSWRGPAVLPIPVPSNIPTNINGVGSATTPIPAGDRGLDREREREADGNEREREEGTHTPTPRTSIVVPSPSKKKTKKGELQEMQSSEPSVMVRSAPLNSKNAVEDIHVGELDVDNQDNDVETDENQEEDNEEEYGTYNPNTKASSKLRVVVDPERERDLRRQPSAIRLSERDQYWPTTTKTKANLAAVDLTPILVGAPPAPPAPTSVKEPVTPMKKQFQNVQHPSPSHSQHTPQNYNHQDLQYGHYHYSTEVFNVLQTYRGLPVFETFADLSDLEEGERHGGGGQGQGYGARTAQDGKMPNGVGGTGVGAAVMGSGGGTGSTATIKLSLSAEQSAAPRDDPRFVIWGDVFPAIGVSSLAVEGSATSEHAVLGEGREKDSSEVGGGSLMNRRRSSKAAKFKSGPDANVKSTLVGSGGAGPNSGTTTPSNADGQSTHTGEGGDAVAASHRVILAATIERWVAQLTSDLNYDEVLNFFLTYRTYISGVDLCHLLICRFHWALHSSSSYYSHSSSPVSSPASPRSPYPHMRMHTSDRESDNVRKIVRVRTFVAIRHWLLTFFTVDFIPNRELRVLLADWLNTLRRDENLKGRSDVMDIVRTLIKVTKQCRSVHTRATEKPKTKTTLTGTKPVAKENEDNGTAAPSADTSNPNSTSVSSATVSSAAKEGGDDDDNQPSVPADHLLGKSFAEAIRKQQREKKSKSKLSSDVMRFKSKSKSSKWKNRDNGKEDDGEDTEGEREVEDSESDLDLDFLPSDARPESEFVPVSTDADLVSQAGSRFSYASIRSPSDSAATASASVNATVTAVAAAAAATDSGRALGLFMRNSTSGENTSVGGRAVALGLGVVGGSGLPLTSLNILHRTEHAPGPPSAPGMGGTGSSSDRSRSRSHTLSGHSDAISPDEDDPPSGPYVFNPARASLPANHVLHAQSALSRAFVRTIGRLGRWKRVVMNANPRLSLSGTSSMSGSGTTYDNYAYDEFEYPQTSSAGSLTRGSVGSTSSHTASTRTSTTISASLVACGGAPSQYFDLDDLNSSSHSHSQYHLHGQGGRERSNQPLPVSRDLLTGSQSPGGGGSGYGAVEQYLGIVPPLPSTSVTNGLSGLNSSSRVEVSVYPTPPTPPPAALRPDPDPALVNLQLGRRQQQQDNESARGIDAPTVNSFSDDLDDDSTSQIATAKPMFIPVGFGRTKVRDEHADWKMDDLPSTPTSSSPLPNLHPGLYPALESSSANTSNASLSTFPQLVEHDPYESDEDEMDKSPDQRSFSSDNNKTKSRSIVSASSFRSSSTDSFGEPLTSDGPLPPTFPGKHSQWAPFDIVSIDDIDFSDTSSILPQGPAYPPGLRRPKKLPNRRKEFEFVRRSEVSSMGIISHESMRDSTATSSTQSGSGGAAVPPPIHRWQMKNLQRTFENVNNDEDNTGDVEAALRRLEGQINPGLAQKKAEDWVREINEMVKSGYTGDASSMYSADEREGFFDEDEVDGYSSDEGEDAAASGVLTTEDENPDAVPALEEDKNTQDEEEEHRDMPLTPMPSHQTPSNFSSSTGDSGPSPHRTEALKPAIEDVVPIEILQSRMPSMDNQTVAPSIRTPTSPFATPTELVTPVPVPVPPPQVHRSFIFSFTIDKLVEHFSMIDRELFISIKFEELMNDEWMECEGIDVLDWAQYVKDRATWKAAKHFAEKTTALAAIRARFNVMVSFVVSDIVLTPPNERHAVVNRFIRLAWKSYSVSNFNTLAAIITALQNPWVTKAMPKAVWSRVGNFESRMLRDLKQFTASMDDFKFMRQVIESIKEKKSLESNSHAPSVASESQSGKGSKGVDTATAARGTAHSSCIPFIGIYLSQLRRLNKLPALIDPTAPTSIIGIDPITAIFDPPAHPEVFAALPPLPPSMHLEPLINVHKQRCIADVIKSFVAGQHLASRVQFEGVVDKKLFQKCLRLRGIDATYLQRALALYD